MSKTLEGAYAPEHDQAHGPLRHLAARALRRASRVLARWARQVHNADASRRRPPPLSLEFHAEDGAEHGALYVNGKLVGYLPGVKRL